MARSKARGRTVLPLNTARPANQRTFGRPEPVGAQASQSHNAQLSPDIGNALAPQQSVMGSGPLNTLTPNVQAYAPEGAPGQGQEGTGLIDALMAGSMEGGTPPEAPSPAASAGGFQTLEATPWGGASGNPAADEALIGAENIYGTPDNPSALSQATQDSMLGSGGSYTLAPGPQYADQYALLRALLGY